MLGKAYRGTARSEKGSWDNGGVAEERGSSLFAPLWRGYQNFDFREENSTHTPSHSLWQKGGRSKACFFSVNYYSLLALNVWECGIVLYLQEPWARFTVCGFTSLWSSTLTCANPKLPFSQPPKLKKHTYLLSKPLFCSRVSPTLLVVYFICFSFFWWCLRKRGPRISGSWLQYTEWICQGCF